MSARQPALLILGTRGIPAQHGGFETFAERLALFLSARGWRVGVYCQSEPGMTTGKITTDVWNGIERYHVAVAASGPLGTLEFDWRSCRDALKRPGVCLILGYNGAVFLPYLRFCGRKIITNMDGIEWRRPKWSRPIKTWFWVNEWIAAWTSHRLIADHPRIADHLATRRSRSAIAVIPYGGDPLLAVADTPVRRLGLVPGRYLVSIARIEPDNSIALMVEAFSRRRRGVKLVVLGELADHVPYHRQVRAAASEDVLFLGKIHEAETVRALRFHALAYLHGHTVGGTNPSLVEALSAGNAVIAHDNPFNRWTAGEAGFYFGDLDECDQRIGEVLTQGFRVGNARIAARRRAAALFDWTTVLEAYEREILALAEAKTPAGARVSEIEVGGVR